jgi:hypothetical protein
VDVSWHGSNAGTLTSRDDAGPVSQQLLLPRQGGLARLRIRWVDPNDRARGIEFVHVFITGDDGLITEIRRDNDVRSAAKAIR